MPLTENKVMQVLEALKGLKKSEWAHIRHAVDRTFEAQADRVTNQLTLDDPDAVMRELRREVDVAPAP